MTLIMTLRALGNVILEEADRNPAFAIQLAEALQLNKTLLQAAGGNSYHSEVTTSNFATTSDAKKRQRSKRRNRAVMDPVHAARDGSDALENALRELSLDQLHDIVAEFGMDTGKLVMKWKDRERVIDRIVEVSTARAHKGDVFRDQRAGSEAGDCKDKSIITDPTKETVTSAREH